MALLKGLSFSVKRAIGVSGLKRQIANQAGVPTTRSGMERKIGKMILDKFLKKNKYVWNDSPIYYNRSTTS